MQEGGDLMPCLIVADANIGDDVMTILAVFR